MNGDWLCVPPGDFRVPNIIAMIQQLAEPACSDLDDVLLELKES